MPLHDDMKIISTDDHVAAHDGECARPSVRRSAAEVSLGELLDLERVEVDLYRSTATFHDPEGLYGGQVLAQSLRAASLTVPDGFVAHSLHGYFVRPGDAKRPVVLQVYRDKDGRSYAARRVVVVQGGEVLLNLAASFHVPEQGPNRQGPQMPVVPPPTDLARHKVLTRTAGVEFLDAEPDSALPTPASLWARVADEVIGDDPNLWACMVTYISDMCTGLFKLVDFDWNVRLTSIDHALWLFRLAKPRWLLLDLQGQSVANGRGFYRGHVFDQDGVLVASLAQESLYRKMNRPRPQTVRRMRETMTTPRRSADHL
jgi:acyl-CoA thioesterase II